MRPPFDMSVDAFLARAVPPADELRERLLSHLAHEIRNPLASALWSAEMLARSAGGDPRRERLGRLSARSVQRLRVLLEDLFALERLPRTPPSGEVPLAAALTRALAAHDLDPEGIPVDDLRAPSGLIVPLDPASLDRLLHACARRAVHAGSGGRLSVHVDPDGPDHVLVTLLRPGARLEEVDPPPLAPGGSEGGGTTFTLLVARVAAQRLGVPLDVVQTPEGVEIRLRLPVRR